MYTYQRWLVLLHKDSGLHPRLKNRHEHGSVVAVFELGRECEKETRTTALSIACIYISRTLLRCGGLFTSYAL